MRCTWLAKLETISRRVARPKIVVEHRPDVRSGVTKPGTSAFVESDSSRSIPVSAEPGERRQVGEDAVQGQLVHLEVAGVQQRPAGVRTATARASGIEWLTEKNSQWNGPGHVVVAGGDLEGVRVEAALAQLRLDQGQGEL